MRAWWLLVPVVVTLLALLAYGLTSDPKHIPSPLIGKVFPQLEGKDLEGNPVTLGVVDGQPTIINFWASWCYSCRAEHAVLIRGSRRYADQVVLIGVDYKDELHNAKAWLRNLGNPYRWSFFDLSGKAGLELGVYGVPETFFVNRQGIIVHKIAGPLSDETLAAGVAMMMNQKSQ